MLLAKLFFLAASLFAPQTFRNEQPYEQPSDCAVRVVRGKRVYTSACRPGPLP